MYSEETQEVYSSAEVEFEIERQKAEIKSAEHRLKIYEALMRLIENEDFKFVFKDYYENIYLQSKVSELAKAISPNNIDLIQADIRSIGLFRAFQIEAVTKGQKAVADIQKAKQTIEYLNSLPTVDEV